MFGIINTKVYLFFSFITTVLLYAIDTFDKQEIVKTWVLHQSVRAQAAGMAAALANFIVRPLAYAVDNPIGAVVGGILWPVLFAWFLLLIVLLAFTLIVPGLATALCTADSGC
jgi:hypothetical protein